MRSSALLVWSGIVGVTSVVLLLIAASRASRSVSTVHTMNVQRTANPRSLFAERHRPDEHLQSSGRHESQIAPSTASCPMKFLQFGNTFGRHSNQLASLMIAFALSRKLNRTLVVPAFLLGSAWENREGRAKRRRASALYDLSALAKNGYCFVEDEDFVAVLNERSARRDTADDGRHGNVELDVACIAMRGIKMHPQLPKGVKSFRCTQSQFVKYKKNVTLFMEALQAPSLQDAAIVTIPLLIYVRPVPGVMPESALLQPWQLLKPLPNIGKIVESILHELRRGRESAFQNDNSDDESEKAKLIGLHLRSLEGSCSARVREMHLASQKKHDALVAQCEMSVEYLSGFALSSTRSAWFLADDGQHMDKVLTITKTFGVFRVASIREKYPQHNFSAQINALLKSDASLPRGMLFLQLDVWVLASCDVFIGNQLSTVSENVCWLRRAANRRCDNFVQGGG